MYNNFSDFMKPFANMKFNPFTDSQSHHAEILSQGGQVAMEASRAIMSRGAEMLNNVHAEFMNFVKESMGSGNQENLLHNQQKFLKQYMKNGMEMVEDVTEVMIKSSKELFKMSCDHVNNTMEDCGTCTPGARKRKNND